jgi:hypothetical protein
MTFFSILYLKFADILIILETKRRNIMKKLFLSLIISLFFLNCYTYNFNSIYDDPLYNIRKAKLTITGDCPLFTVNDYEYSNLPTPFIINNHVLNQHQIIIYEIQKYTDDTTTINAILNIDGIDVQNLSTSDPYGYIEISYIIEPI